MYYKIIHMIILMQLHIYIYIHIIHRELQYYIIIIMYTNMYVTVYN